MGTRPTWTQTLCSTTRTQTIATHKLSETTTFSALTKRARAPSSASLNNKLGRNTRVSGAGMHPVGDRAKAAPGMHETDVVVKAVQQLLRRALLTPSREECG